MKYACIDHRRDHYPVRLMCRLLQVSASGYYAWRARPESSRAQSDRALMTEIRRVHQDSKGVYGSPRVHAELVSNGICVGRHKVARLMRLARLRGCPRRRFRVTTQRDPSHPVARNLLKQNFSTKAPNQRWAADITYISTQEGWLYLAVVIDLCSRKVVGWSMSSRMKAQLVCDALIMAVWQRRPGAGLIHHSDRGSQYACKAFRKLLKKNGIKGSMSRKGDCWDNAVVESFFGSLKQERVHWRHYQTRNEAQQDILNYISVFYNNYRLHSTLGYVSPSQYEIQLTEMRKAS